MSWSTFKQRLREKVGRGQVTSIPTDIECQMEYVETSRFHVKAIAQAIDKMVDPWKKSGLNQPECIADVTGELGALLENKNAGQVLIACSESHKYIGKLERKAYEDVVKLCQKDFCQAWINSDFQRLHAISKELKEARLLYDARKNDYLKKQTEEKELSKRRAEENFVNCAAEATTAFEGLPALQKTHTEQMKAVLKRLRDHYDQCYEALKSTIVRLEKL